jgi:hypothetical protein
LTEEEEAICSLAGLADVWAVAVLSFAPAALLLFPRMSRPERRPHSKRADASAAAAESVSAVPAAGAAAAAAGGLSAALSSPAAAALERSRVAAAQRASATQNGNNTDAHSGDEEEAEKGTRTAGSGATPAGALARGRNSTGSSRKSAPCAFCEKSVNLNGDQDVTWMGPFNYDGQQRFVHGSCAKVGTHAHRRAFKAERGAGANQAQQLTSLDYVCSGALHLLRACIMYCVCVRVYVYVPVEP